MEEDVLLDQCPHCDAMWGIEEMSFQECDCCGYPRQQEEEKEDWDDDFDSLQDKGYEVVNSRLLTNLS